MGNNEKITVFGATGKIGRTLLSLLSNAEIQTIAVTRNLDRTEHLPFVEWVEADLADQKSLYKTMQNSRSVFLLSGLNTNFVNEQNNAIQVAKETSVDHIVKLSSGGADKHSAFHIARVHGEVEEFLKNSDIPSTFLRPTGFMQNWLGELAQTVKRERKIYEATGEGKRAYVDLRDIAEVAFKVLTEGEKHFYHAYSLTGDEAINYRELAALLSEAITEPVEYKAISLEEGHYRMEQKGIPEFAIKALMAYTKDQRNGKTNFVSNDVRDILHKPARTAQKFVKDHLEYFK